MLNFMKLVSVFQILACELTVMKNQFQDTDLFQVIIISKIPIVYFHDSRINVKSEAQNKDLITQIILIFP